MKHYNFPVISTIDDVLPHIEGREEFRVMEKDWYTVVNYIVAFDDTFPSISVSGGSAKMREERSLSHRMRRECRGLIFDKKGKLISRPYHKFFNVGEKEETQLNKINLYESHVVLEKLDGSMIRPIPTDDGFRLATKAGVTDVAMNAEVFIADKPHYSTFIKKCIQKGTTPIFEWCSRKNRIVVDYPEDQLILTGIRYTNTGEYIVHDVMKRYAEAWGIPVVKAFAWNKGQKIDDRIEDMVNMIRLWEDSEGVVLRFDSGQMIKIKADDYVLRHKSKDAINQEKNVIGVLVEDALDDLIPLLTPEDAHRIQTFSRAFWLAVEDVASDLHDRYAALEKRGSQKDFAMIVTSQVPKHLQHFMFGAYRGESMRDLLVKSISKSLSTQTKVDAARWMWGNLNWHSA